jgi:hypothetical protein
MTTYSSVVQDPVVTIRNERFVIPLKTDLTFNDIGSIAEQIVASQSFNRTEEAAKLRKGEARYQDGVAAEKAGDMKGAVKAYVESARLGHPLADLRLGQLYDKDTSKTLPRDLQESITHYQKAREFGIEIKGPTDRAPQVTNTYGK